MNVIHCKPAHSDARGVITDIHVGQPVNALTTVTCVKGAIRGNHFHKLTTQFTYVMSGRLRYFSQSPGAPIESCIVVAGDLVTSLPFESHAFESLEDSVLLAFCQGVRAGVDYEKDTYRIEESLIRNQAPKAPVQPAAVETH
jgi:quercetin dioxygenase-like cupin family protein